jgi:hypothetical protein
MIDLYYWPTPNNWKISILLEECGVPYRVVPVNIGRGEQFLSVLHWHQFERPRSRDRRSGADGRWRATGCL